MGERVKGKVKGKKKKVELSESSEEEEEGEENKNGHTDVDDSSYYSLNKYDGKDGLNRLMNDSNKELDEETTEELEQQDTNPSDVKPKAKVSFFLLLIIQHSTKK